MTPRIREQVFARDHHRCTVPGCRSARNLEVHHIVEQARGGMHELWNLTLLCSGHHAALHGGLLAMRGQAPYLIEFRWVYGPPIPVGLDPAARKAVIDQRVQEISQASDETLRSEYSSRSDRAAHHTASQLGRQARRKRS